MAACRGSCGQGLGLFPATLPSPCPTHPFALPPQVLLSLTDNWQPTGGADEMVRWAGGGSHEAFFSDPRAKALYKGHVAAVLGRVNSLSGRRYADDPTIFGWNLINEPRCYQCGATLAAWVREMAAYVKGLNPNHLLTVRAVDGGRAEREGSGHHPCLLHRQRQQPAAPCMPPAVQVGEEGFYPAGQPQASSQRHALCWGCPAGDRLCNPRTSRPTPPCPPQTAANPQGAGSWANTEGQDFRADHASPDINFMSIHLWVSNW